MGLTEFSAQDHLRLKPRCTLGWVGSSEEESASKSVHVWGIQIPATVGPKSKLLGVG